MRSSERGVGLDVRRPRYGDPLPETLDEHCGAIIFGGPMSANDADDFVRREIDWIAVPLQEQKPFLGICLGGQMLARQLGGKVCPHPHGHAEIGYYPIRPTALARSICDPWPDHVYQWHREGFDLPDGAELIAEGDTFPVQAFRYGDAAYALQFHPDVTHAHHLPLDHPRPRAHVAAGRQAARTPTSPTAPCTTRPAAPGSRRSWITGCRRSGRPEAECLSRALRNTSSVLRCRPGTVPHSELGTIPDRRCNTWCCTWSGKSIEAAALLGTGDSCRCLFSFRNPKSFGQNEKCPRGAVFAKRMAFGPEKRPAY